MFNVVNTNIWYIKVKNCCTSSTIILQTSLCNSWVQQTMQCWVDLICRSWIITLAASIPPTWVGIICTLPNRVINNERKFPFRESSHPNLSLLQGFVITITINCVISTALQQVFNRWCLFDQMMLLMMILLIKLMLSMIMILWTMMLMTMMAVACVDPSRTDQSRAANWTDA